jgi:hypothetical protein
VREDTPFRTNLSSVEPLTEKPRRCASREPAAPPRAKPTWRWISATRRVRRAYAGANPGSRSTNTLRGHPVPLHRNRRDATAMITPRPCQGKSANVRRYRLCMRFDSRQHSGHLAVRRLGSASMMMRPPSVTTRRVMRSLGTSVRKDCKDDQPICRWQSHPLSLIRRPSTRPAAPKMRKSPDSTPIDTLPLCSVRFAARSGRLRDASGVKRHS